MDETTRLQNRDSNIHSGNFWSGRTFLEKALLILLIVVIVVGIALSITLASYKREHCHQQPDSHAKKCETPECVRAAAYLINSIDTSVKPCDDFFSFACGGFINKTFLLGKVTGRFSKLNVNILLRMKDLLDQPFMEDDPEHWNKTRQFYKACMDLESRQEENSGPLRDALKKMGGWPLLEEEWDGTDFSWTGALKTMFHEGYNKDILLQINVNLDFKNSTTTLITIDQPDLEMPRNFYLLEPDHNYALSAYKMLILKCARLLNDSIDLVEMSNQIDDAVEIEIRLAEASLSNFERKNVSMLYENNVITLQELQEKYRDIQWKDLIESFLPEGVILAEDEKIWVPVPSAIAELQNILEEVKNNSETKRKLANYMMYRAVVMAAPDLSHAFVQSSYDFHNALDNTPYSYPDPWQQCVDITGTYFFYSLSSAYTKKYFQAAAKENVTSVVTGIKDILKDEITKAAWMDNETKQKALLKAYEMRAVVGYPEEILNDTILDCYFKEVLVDDIHYVNVREASKFYSVKDMEDLHTTYDKHKWDAIGSHLLRANAYYSAVKNTITIPVGVLQDETYNAKKPNYLNYGSLGILIGHELTHGFDMSGSQFDERGDWKFWWTENTYEELQTRSQCFVEQYDSYDVPGTNKTVNGTATLNENMADTGGVEAAYKAYQSWVQKYGQEKPLPGLPYTPNQLFWLSFASVWCSKETPAHLLYAITSQEHAPTRYRVQGVLSNLKEFSADFKCKENSPMNPEKKCSLWT